mmetsp:Transcript_16659/g.50027  ORF Transcript_16659/g.50027 Transcript_16659/m.50027 type:complete len:252 (-) Transcript_16659:607-1362(-)
MCVRMHMHMHMYVHVHVRCNSACRIMPYSCFCLCASCASRFRPLYGLGTRASSRAISRFSSNESIIACSSLATVLACGSDDDASRCACCERESILLASSRARLASCILHSGAKRRRLCAAVQEVPVAFVAFSCAHSTAGKTTEVTKPGSDAINPSVENDNGYASMKKRVPRTVPLKVTCDVELKASRRRSRRIESLCITSSCCRNQGTSSLLTTQAAALVASCSASRPNCAASRTSFPAWSAHSAASISSI